MRVAADERGAASLLVAFVGLALLTFGGVVVIDGGFVNAAEGMAGRVAHAIALDVALNHDVDSYRAGTLSIDGERAATRAAELAEGSGHTLEAVSVDGARVTVVVIRPQPTPIRRYFGDPFVVVRGVGSAELVALP